MSVRVVVVGAGGIGGFIAGALARVGTDVAVIARGAHLRAIQKHGLRVRSAALGDFTVRPFASSDPREAAGAGIVLCTFKSHQWAGLLERMRVFGQNGATIVTLQNGVPFWYAQPPLQSVDPDGRIAAMFSRETIVGGVVHSSGEIVEPGHIAQSGRVLYPLGSADGGMSERAQNVVDLLRHAGLDAQPEPEIRRRVWAKLINNASLNPVSALCGLTVHALLAQPQWIQRVRNLMSETIAVGNAAGVAEGLSVAGQLDVAAHIADVKTSMLQDREAGRPLELEPIVGAVIELGRRLNVPTPELQAVFEVLS